jgi:hypothetical protein
MKLIIYIFFRASCFLLTRLDSRKSFDCWRVKQLVSWLFWS